MHSPGTHPFLWTVLVLTGALAAVALQGLLTARAGGDVRTATTISLGASAVGYLAAKIWYLVMHHQPPRAFAAAGTYIQGFLVGAFGTAVIALGASHTPVGAFLDRATPGVLFAMALGRPGCFFGGCCSGRPTASRWGLFSSDRRVGIRRIPTQLIEGGLALVIGGITLALDLTDGPQVRGALFAGAFALYTLGRQLIFPLRAEPRRTSRGIWMTTAGGLLILGYAAWAGWFAR